MFEAFPKIPRLYRDCVITEKLDGTNAQVYIETLGARSDEIKGWTYCERVSGGTTFVYAGSRKRIITPDNDNFGFAAWVQQHGTELIAGLGEGRHYGEWWGKGINRGYDLDERRFSLFNIGRWNEGNVPGCCSVVPTLFEGVFSTLIVEEVKEQLVYYGSTAAPGYMSPEGVVVYHSASNQLFKSLIENDESPKGNNE